MPTRNGEDTCRRLESLLQERNTLHVYVIVFRVAEVLSRRVIAEIDMSVNNVSNMELVVQDRRKLESGQRTKEKST